ncbi:MAG: outer membrane protein assembly factor BamE [Candidatus Schekmanbacteria bacterium]|nr:outer membrane protein assembly factor BamE [Candidatus Schekmanbacteria bacterium]
MSIMKAGYVHWIMLTLRIIIWLLVSLFMAFWVYFLHPGLGTLYSKNYSERAFTSIKIGMSQKHVLDILGEPLSTIEYDDSSVVYHYSDASGSSYYVRFIKFRDGKVTEVAAFSDYD